MWAEARPDREERGRRRFGLEAPAAADVLEPALRSDYRVGDVIGVWPTYHLSETELIAGRDNGHLDFRVSVLRDEQTVAVSTVCNAHNVYGRLYLRVIVPFHRAGFGGDGPCGPLRQALDPGRTGQQKAPRGFRRGPRRLAAFHPCAPD